MTIPYATEPNKVIEILKNPLTLTTNWQDVCESGPIDTKGLLNIALWVDSTLNDSDKIEWKVVCLPSKDSTDEYQTQIQTVGAADIVLNEEKYETSQADFKGVFPLGISKLSPWVKIRFKVGVAGATSAVVNKVFMTGERG